MSEDEKICSDCPKVGGITPLHNALLIWWNIVVCFFNFYFIDIAHGRKFACSFSKLFYVSCNYDIAGWSINQEMWKMIKNYNQLNDWETWICFPINQFICSGRHCKILNIPTLWSCLSKCTRALFRRCFNR